MFIATRIEPRVVLYQILFFHITWIYVIYSSCKSRNSNCHILVDAPDPNIVQQHSLSNHNRCQKMSNNELKIVVTTALKSLLSSHKLNTPVASMDLLTSVMTTKMPLGLLPDGIRTPRFRLTDLSKFEKILEDLAQTWTEGKIVISRDDGSKKLMIWEVVSQHHNGLIGSFSSVGSGDDASGSKKRKRVVDEDADSAVGDEESNLDEEEDNARDSRSSFANLSKEMREVYTILQKSTAKGRLLAEQVCLLVKFLFYFITTLLSLVPFSCRTL